MPSLTVSSAFDYIGVLLLLLGFFLILAGLNVLKIEKVTVASGRRTWFLGIILAVFGIGFLIPNGYSALSNVLGATHAVATTASISVATPVLPTQALSVTPTPKPTATINADPTLYDDFNGASFNGSINTSIWITNFSSGCDVAQRDGAMESRHATPSTGDECYLILGYPTTVGVNQLGAVEARIKIDNNYNGSMGQGIIFSTGDQPGRDWMVACHIKVVDGEVMQDMGVGTYEKPEFSRYLPAEIDHWYTVRLEVNPDNMMISCFVDNNLLGAEIPNNVAALKSARFRRSIQSYYDPNSSATTHVDEVRVMP